MSPFPVSNQVGFISLCISIIFDTHKLDISVPLLMHLEITPFEHPIACSSALVLIPFSLIRIAILSEIFVINRKLST